MWKLNDICAENICSFGNLHYVLNQGVTTLVFGNNLDNDSQRSNGSGKSALIECIALGITGAPLRKVKNEEILTTRRMSAGFTCNSSMMPLMKCLLSGAAYFAKGALRWNAGLSGEAKRSRRMKRYAPAWIPITNISLKSWE